MRMNSLRTGHGIWLQYVSAPSTYRYPIYHGRAPPLVFLHDKHSWDGTRWAKYFSIT